MTELSALLTELESLLSYAQNLECYANQIVSTSMRLGQRPQVCQNIALISYIAPINGLQQQSVVKDSAAKTILKAITEMQPDHSQRYGMRSLHLGIPDSAPCRLKAIQSIDRISNTPKSFGPLKIPILPSNLRATRRGLRATGMLPLDAGAGDD